VFCSSNSVRSGRLLPRDSGVGLTDLSTAGTEAHLLRAAFQSSADAIVLVDDAGTISGRNNAAERMFGVSDTGQFQGPIADLFAPERRDEIADLIRRTVRGKPARATAVALHNDGSRLIVEFRCSAADGVNGRPATFVVVLRDVTEAVLVRSAAAAVAFEADASAALDSFAAVLRQVVPVEDLSLAAVEGEVWRRVASAGRCAEKLRTGEVGPLAATSLRSAVHRRQPIVCLDTRAGEFPYDEVLAQLGIGSYVVLPLFHRGDVVGTLNIGFATADAPTAGVVALLTSLTDSIMPIVLNLVTLEEQAGVIRRLEQLDAFKNEFLALITHEIRTPLAIITGFGDHLQNRWDELEDEEKLESLATIQRNSRNLYRLVEEGLQIAQLESGHFDYKLVPVDLAEETRRVAADLANAGADRVRISVGPKLPLVLCDTHSNRQILTNLLTNALKFSPDDTPIDVELTRHATMVRVAVRDRGPGIARADVPKLFRKFSRVGGRDQLLVAGSGLGLYIAKAMVEAQGGRIWVESEPGVGSTFVYTLPVAESAEA
jgi:PAS domain S-box-containing protein